MRVLVTGGAGYIGSVVATELLGQGHEVVVLDDLSSGHGQAVPEEAQLIVGDVRDSSVVKNVLETHSIEAVVHFAANIQVGESMREPLKYVGDNVKGALAVAEAMLSAGVTKLVFSSSAAIFAPSDEPIAEEAPIGPASPYGESKYMIERALRWLDETAGLRYISLRYFNAAGAWNGKGEDHCPESHLIPLVLKVALGQSSNVILYGDDYPTPDGTCIRDYVHVLDLATAHALALAALGEGSRVYNLGNGQGFSVREVIQVARRITGHPIPEVVGTRRPGDSPWLVADSRRIREELGWRPRFSAIEDIVASAWEWHREHPHGYGNGATT